MDTQKLLFCHYYLKTCDADMAAKMAGYRGLPPGEAVRWLAQKPFGRMVRRLKAQRDFLPDAYQAAARLAEIAFGPATDALKLAFLPKDAPPEELDGLDLRQVSQISRKSDGSVEVRLVDRLDALSRLMEFFSEQERETGGDLLCALERAGTASGTGDDDEAPPLLDNAAGKEAAQDAPL